MKRHPHQSKLRENKENSGGNKKKGDKSCGWQNNTKKTNKTAAQHDCRQHSVLPMWMELLFPARSAYQDVVTCYGYVPLVKQALSVYRPGSA